VAKRKARDFEVCGLVGSAARASARSLLDGVKVDKKEAEDAVAHINGCDFCKMRIKNDIHDSREGKGKKVYLDSLPETLGELQKRIS
jgi:hypothetical protein